MAKKNDDEKKDEKDQASDVPEADDEPKLKPLTEAKRKRLQKAFDHGNVQSSKGEFDYAHSMYTQCVAGDPGNLIYTQNLLTNLIKKYNNNKKGGKLAGMRGAGAKANMKKASVKKDWQAVIRAGLDYMLLNPWDTATLVEMAKACDELEIGECQAAYLRMALDGNPKDISLNKTAAGSFERLALFDEAIRCLDRVAQQQPKNQDVRRQISQLTVQKTIHKGGYEEAERSLDVSVEKQTQDKKVGGQMELTEEQRLRREMRRHPEEVTNHINLSEYFFKLEDYEAAEQVMKEGVEITGSVRAREELEDIQLHRARSEVIVAQKRAAEKKTDEAKALYGRMRDELNKRELEIYSRRGDRYPNDFNLKYELGLRLKRAGNFQEAIKQFQQARAEARKTAAANLETGECFQQIKQYKLALQSYKEAIETCGQWDEEVKKLALYRAGWLSKGLKDFEAADEFLSELAGKDFGYKDVAELLDEISKKRNEEPT